MTKRYAVEFNAKVVPVEPLNDEFTLCKCYVMALEKNRNLSFISKDAADTALPTLFNIPVIGHLYVGDDGSMHMGGHDMTIVQNKDGQYEFKSICVPYGVVPQQENIHYEDVQEPNGDTHTYLVADVILWTGRFPELNEAIYSDKTYFGQSMEINVSKHEPLNEDKNYTNILEYTYSALCLLGKSDDPELHVEPCFPMSRLDAYEFSIEDEKFTELMLQLKEELAFCFGDRTKKGGQGMDENTTVTTEQIDTVPEVLEDAPATEDTAPDAFAENEQPETENAVVEPDEQSATDNFESEAPASEEGKPVQSFSSTYREKREAIENALPCVHEVDENGHTVRDVWYWICDFDETHVFVEKSEYLKETGCTEIKGRFAYTFDETAKTASINGDMEEMFVKWLTREELSQIEEQRTQYEELVAYKQMRTQKDHEAAIDAAIAEFSDLEGTDEFAAIVVDKYSYATVDTLRDACYIVRGKRHTPAASSKQSVGASVPVGTIEEPDKYDAFFSKYGKKR